MLDRTQERVSLQPKSWTASRIELLTALRAEGVSFSLIAEQVSAIDRDCGPITRNGCIGKAGRLGLASFRRPVTARDRPDRLPRIRTRATKFRSAALPRAVAAPPVQSPMPIAPVVPPLRLTLMQLEFGQCRFPLGDPSAADFAFCGLPVEAGRPYCPHCCTIAYVKQRRVTQDEREQIWRDKADRFRALNTVRVAP